MIQRALSAYGNHDTAVKDKFLNRVIREMSREGNLFEQTRSRTIKIWAAEKHLQDFVVCAYVFDEEYNEKYVSS